MGRIKNLIRNINYLTKHSLWDQREEDIVYLTDKILDDGFYEYELLNRDDAEKIRRGYSVHAFNSVGVVNVDSEGTAWMNLEKEWNERAENTDAKYFRFVKTLRDIAQDFHEQAKYMKDHYDF